MSKTAKGLVKIIPCLCLSSVCRVSTKIDATFSVECLSSLTFTILEDSVKADIILTVK